MIKKEISISEPSEVQRTGITTISIKYKFLGFTCYQKQLSYDNEWLHMSLDTTLIKLL